MTIANFEFDLIGAHTYYPEGPYGAGNQFPTPSFKPGTVVAGDMGGEFIFLNLGVTAALTMNQGDVVEWDNSMSCHRVGDPAGAGTSILGDNIGTLFLGGRSGDPAAAPAGGNIWQYVFPAVGTYGIWAQRAGISLMNLGAITTLATAAQTSTGAIGKVTLAAGGTNPATITGIGVMPVAFALLTCATTSGSAVITSVGTNKGLVRGMTLSGTGFTGAALGAVITDIQGSSITASLAAISTNGSVTITATNGSAFATTQGTTGTATQLINVTSINGFYPNQTITGTGIPGATTIVSIVGNAAPYIINMSASATGANANNVAVTAAQASNYSEVFLTWPLVSVAN